MDNQIEQIVEQFYKISQLTTNTFNHPIAYGEGYTLFTAEAHTLKYISDSEGITAKEIARATFKTKSAVSMIIDQLTSKELVMKKRNESDKRVYNLYTTELGKKVDQIHRNFDKRSLEKVAENLDCTLEELVTAEKVLQLFINYFGNRYNAK